MQIYQFFIHFNCGKLFQCIDKHTSVYSLFSWCILELFPHFDSYKQCCYNVHARVFMYKYVLSSLGYIPRSKITVIHTYFILIFSWNCCTVLLSGCTFSHAKYEGSNFFISSVILVIVSFYLNYRIVYAFDIFWILFWFL